MKQGNGRLVRRIQERVSPFQRNGARVAVAPSELAELRARVHRLRAIGDRFACVGVSRFVAADAQAAASGCIGG